MQAACNMGQLRKTFSSFTKLFTNSFHLKAWKRVASWETFFYDLKMFLLKSFKIPLLFYSLQTSQTCLSFYRHTFRVCWASVQNMPLIEYAIKNKCKQIIMNHNASIQLDVRLEPLEEFWKGNPNIKTNHNNICNSFLSSSKLFSLFLFLLWVLLSVLALSSCKQPYDASRSGKTFLLEYWWRLSYSLLANV